MDCLHDFDQQLKQVFEACHAKMALYPAPFREEALHWLESYDVFEEDFHNEYMSFLLPFWMQTPFGIEEEIVRKISMANLFGLFYFLEQDAVMDTLPGEYKGDRLPLAHLFLLDFMEVYRGLFPSDSPFWAYFRTFFTEWAQSVLFECQGGWNQGSESTSGDLMALAHKAAPQKLTVAAVCTLSGKIERVKVVAKAVDATAVSIQLLDDWFDWQEDLQNGTCTYFLSEVMRCCGIKDIGQVKGTHYVEAIYSHGLFDEMYAAAKKNHIYIEGCNISYLVAYHQTMLDKYYAIAMNIQREKTVMLHGGLSQWMGRSL